MDYRINKGAGRPIEFKGLKSQYLFFFAGGLVSVFLAVVVLYMAGVSQLVCLSFRGGIRYPGRMADLPHECPLR